MKKNIIPTICMALIAPFALSACQSEKSKKADTIQTLQFMTYNIRNGLGMDNVRNIDRIVPVIQKQNPDVLAIQELDSANTRSEGKYVLGILGERTQMYATYAPAIDYAGGKYGVGMLSKEKPVNFEYHALPGREEQRTFLMVEFKDYIYCCTHISLTPEDQVLSLPIINELTAKYKKPVIIAGDMNSHPDSEFIQGLQKSFTLVSPADVMTYPADIPTETIDYIAIHHKDTAKVKATSSQVVNEPLASDHRPIIATISIKK